ncbi:MAG: DNA translocase FtsK 4TM domain-containing protein, partial [Planctomycetota bacterium]
MAASNPFQRELCAVAFLGVGVFLGVSLATYSPSDPVSDSLGPLSALYRPDQVEYPAVEEISNSCGRWGALAADLLLTGVGAGAYYAVGSILVLSGFLFLRAGLEGPLFRFAGWLGSLVGVSSLAALLFPEWSPGPMVGSGGYLGALGAGLLLHHFAMFGSLLLAGSFVVGGMLMCSDHIFPSILRWTLGGFLAPLLRRREPVMARVNAGRPQRTPNKSPPVKIAPTKSKREKAAAAAAVATEGNATVGRSGLSNGAAGPRSDDDSSPSILPIRGRGKAGSSAVAEDGELTDEDDSFAGESTESSVHGIRGGSRNLGLAGATPKPASQSAGGRGRGV